MKTIRSDIQKLAASIKTLDNKVVAIFLSVVILQTLSWYYASDTFYRNGIFYELYGYYPDTSAGQYIYWFLSDSFILFIIPVLIILLGFKEKLKDYGLGLGNIKTGLYYTVIAFVTIGIVVFAVGLFLPGFQYSFFGYTFTGPAEAVLMWTLLLFYVIAWEFTWRGFMLFGLYDRFGVYSVFIQMIPFVILHNGKMPAETFLAIPGALILGALALRTKSVYYGAIIHFGLIFILSLIT